MGPEAPIEGRRGREKVLQAELSRRAFIRNALIPSGGMTALGPAAGEPDREEELEIAGGGAGGLAAAYRLRDRDLLLLEALPRLGGNSMYFEWEGMPFSLGGQYIGTPGTWADPVWELCGELGLEPETDTSPP